MKIEENVPFSAITTFKVGGVARYLITLESLDDLPEVVAFAKHTSLPLVPIGGGSNILGPDGVLDAVLVRVQDDTRVFADETVTVGAGASWDRVVREAVEHGLWGIENLSAIPGTIGGAVVQNIGAYGAVLSDVIESVRVFDTHQGMVREILRSECAFGYRTSIYKSERDRFIILSATLKLSFAPKPNLGYADLKSLDASSPVNMIRDAVLHVRAQKFPDLSEFGTAGSFFLNPIADADMARALQSRFPNMPVFDLPEGGIKIPLGWFFEHVLQLKGVRSGAVEAWRAQALVIAAHPGATSEEIKNFVAHITDRAKKELQIDIVPEVRVL
jgi:UDP-N-acetylmuramate dehydrogenase